MNILFITHCTGMAGANRSMLQLILELKDNYGVEPFVLLPEYNGQNRTLKDSLMDNGIPYKETFISYFKKVDQSAYSQWDTIVSYRRIKRLAREFLPYNFDIVHSNSSVIDFGGYLSRELGIRHIWHLRDFGDLDYSLNSVFGKTYERLTYRNAEAFIAISDCIKKHFSKTIDPNKITTIYNGINPTPNIPLSLHKNKKTQFLCAGIYGDAKNQMEILRAVDILVNDYHLTGFHVTMVGIGVKGQYAQELKRYATEHSIGQYVSILGEVDGITKLASTMDVGIMSSRNEAFGRVTVEYMLQNLAVIANDSGANTEIIENGVSGLIYSRGDIAALADIMELLIRDKVQLEYIASQGYKRAVSSFLSCYNTKAVYELYEDVQKNTVTSNNYWSNMVCSIIRNYYHVWSYLMLKQYSIRAKLHLRELYNKFIKSSLTKKHQ